MPRADFVCLGRKCQTPDGEAPTHELPVSATRCPVCGSKRLKRLFNKVGVVGTRSGVAPHPDWRMTGTSLTRRADAMLQDSFDAHTKRKPARDMPAFEAGPREREVSLPGGRKFLVPGAQQAAAMVGVAGKGHALEPAQIAASVRAGNPVTRMLGYDHNGARTPQPLPTVSAGRPKS